MMNVASYLAIRLSALSETRTDGQLLVAFLSDRDESAFGELVRRHGPLVWAACRRMLPDRCDAEDAFQATFLVLVRRARRLARQSAIGPWLYQVATWTARNIRRRNARRLACSAPLTPETVEPMTKPADVALGVDIDAALHSLPEKYRTPLILCHLQGWTRSDAAAQLGCPEGTLSSLLSRGLDRLRLKLKGLDPKKLLTIATPMVPLALANSTTKAAAGLKLASAGAISSTVFQLTEGVLRMFWIKKVTAASFAMFVVFGFGIGIGISVNRVPGASADDGPQASQNARNDADFTQLYATDELTQALQKEMHGIEAALEKAKAIGASRQIESLTERLLVARKQLETRQQELAAILVRFTETRRDMQKAKEAALPDQLKLLKLMLSEVQVQIKHRLADLEAAKGNMQQAAAVNNQKARDAAGNEIERIHALLLKLQPEERELLAKIAAVEANLARFDAVWQMRLLEKHQADLTVLELQLVQMRREQELLQTKVDELARAREVAKLKIAKLQVKVVEKPVDALSKTGSLEIVIGGGNKAMPFAVREFSNNGKLDGTVYFENVDMLSRYLVRTGKDSTGPKKARITAQDNDVQYATIKSIIDACNTSGIKPPESFKIR